MFNILCSSTESKRILKSIRKFLFNKMTQIIFKTFTFYRTFKGLSLKTSVKHQTTLGLARKIEMDSITTTQLGNRDRFEVIRECVIHMPTYKKWNKTNNTEKCKLTPWS